MNVVSLAGGGLHNVAVQSTGVVRAWGWNAYGQLADRTLTDRPSPVRVWPVPGASVTAGLAHTTVSAGLRPPRLRAPDAPERGTAPRISGGHPRRPERAERVPRLRTPGPL